MHCSCCNEQKGILQSEVMSSSEINHVAIGVILDCKHQAVRQQLREKLVQQDFLKWFGVAPKAILGLIYNQYHQAVMKKK